jgi:hypothetical protein
MLIAHVLMLMQHLSRPFVVGDRVELMGSGKTLVGIVEQVPPHSSILNIGIVGLWNRCHLIPIPWRPCSGLAFLCACACMQDRDLLVSGPVSLLSPRRESHSWSRFMNAAFILPQPQIVLPLGFSHHVHALQVNPMRTVLRTDACMPITIPNNVSPHVQTCEPNRTKCTLLIS